jgi:hypothetical protein
MYPHEVQTIDAEALQAVLDRSQRAGFRVIVDDAVGPTEFEETALLAEVASWCFAQPIREPATDGRCGMAEIGPRIEPAQAVGAPSRAVGPPPHQFRGFSLDTVIRGLSNTCPREVTDGEVTLIWEIPVKR